MGCMAHLPQAIKEYVNRREEEVLLSTLTQLAGYRTARWQGVVLSGLAGAGKTALAHGLAGDDRVRRTFRDGVFWIAGSQSAKAEAKRMCLALGLARTPGERWVAGWQRWAGAPARRCLLIVDGAVSGAVLPPLVAGLGPQAVVLVTTQNGVAIRAELERWLPAGTVTAVSVAGLAPAESRQLVEAIFGQRLAAEEWDVVREIGERIGWHAEALRLAASEGREIGWRGLLGELQGGRLPWAEIQRSLTDQWSRLPGEQQAWLSDLVMPAAPDTGFTAASAAELWGVAPAVAARRLWSLHSCGLVTADSPAAADAARSARGPAHAPDVDYAGRATGRRADVGHLHCADAGREQHAGYWVQDCATATQNILLTCHALGLGAVWIGV